LITELTTDKSVIKSILCHPAIYATIAGDNTMPPEEFDPPLTDCEYLAGIVDGEPMALMVYHNVDDRLKVHVQVLPDYRHEYASLFGAAAMDYGKTKASELYAEIPVCYPNVLQFAYDHGFEDIGVKEMAYTKRGMNYNVIELRCN